MNNWKEFESNTLKLISEQLKNAGFDIEYNNGLDNNVQVLISGLPRLGEAKRQKNLEMCFLPIEEVSRKTMEYNYLQFFVAIQNDISNSIQNDLISLANSMNSTLPIGSFGVLTKDKLLYYRYCCPITQNMTEKNIEAIIDANVAMIINVLNVYIDMLCDVADGKQSGDEILGNNTDNSSGVN